jgi:hypothetical protein
VSGLWKCSVDLSITETRCIMPDEDTPFILYTGSARLSRDNRRQIATYIGKNFRNRSKPSVRKDGISLDFQNGAQLEARTSEDPEATAQTAPKPLRQGDDGSKLDRGRSSGGQSRRISPFPGSRTQILSVFANHDGYGVGQNPFNVLPIVPRGNVDKMISYCRR